MSAETTAGAAPRKRHALAWALVLSGLGHLAWVGWVEQRSLPHGPRLASAPLQVRWADAQPTPTPGPATSANPKIASPQSVPDRPAATAQPATVRAAAPWPKTVPAPGPSSETPSAAEAPPAPPAPPVPVALAHWPPSGRWAYAFSWKGEQGEALLDWQHDGERFRLQLQRRTAQRALPTWRSEGQLTPTGLRPERFQTERQTERPRPERAGRPPAAPTGLRGQSVAVPEGAQDRLSWWLQVAGSLAGRFEGRLPPGAAEGELLELDVVGWRGERQRWQLRLSRDGGLVRVDRLLPDGVPLEQQLWLDPAQGYAVARLRLRYDDEERWEMQRTGVPPPGACQDGADCSP